MMRPAFDSETTDDSIHVSQWETNQKITEDVLDASPVSWEQMQNWNIDDWTAVKDFSILEGLECFSVLDEPCRQDGIMQQQGGLQLSKVHQQIPCNTASRLSHETTDCCSSTSCIRHTLSSEKQIKTQLVTDVLLHDVRSWPPSSDTEQHLVEVSSGFFVRLRGLNETRDACMQCDRFMTAQCACCRALLRCVHDAEFVLCEGCAFISPVDNPSPSQSKDCMIGGGLGFGLIGMTGLEKGSFCHAAKSAGNATRALSSNLHERQCSNTGGSILS